MAIAQTAYNVYSAHRKQAAFHRAVRAGDYTLFNGGRGSGKTTAGAIQAILESIEYQPGSKGVIVAPTYPMLEDATMSEFFMWLPRQYIRDWQKQRKVLTLTNGSEIAFRSADNADSLRGPNRAWAWLDEPRNLRTREAFDIVVAQLRPRVKCWLTTTPAGIFHWLYELFIAKPMPGSSVITVRTNENPYLPDEYTTRLKTQYTGAFAAQEIDAEWVSFEGRVYDNFSVGDNVSTEADYNPALPIIWGCDDGYASGQGPGTAGYHPRVILLCQETPQGGLHVFNARFACNELAEQSIDAVMSLGYPAPDRVYVDSSAAELRGRIWQRGIQTISATHPVSEGIKNLRRLICDGQGVRLLKIHPRCSELIRELQSYRYDPASSAVQAGEPKPLKLDDHGADALRYATFHLRYG